MQWFPTPPTDNLYKFFAITGLLMLGGALFAILALAYLSYRIDVETNDSVSNFSSQQNQQKFNNRIIAIEGNQPDKDMIPYLSDKLNNDVEFLKKSLKLQSEMSAGYKAREADTLDLVFNFVRAQEIFAAVVSGIYVAIASTLSVLGISYWYKNIQLPSERLNELEEEIKKASLLKLQIEISQLQPMSETVKTLFELGGIMRPPK